jgi:hypothetical protein
MALTPASSTRWCAPGGVREALPAPEAIASRPMSMAVFTVLGACVMVIAYAFNVSGPVCAILFLGGVFTGAFIRVAQPIIDWITRP